MLVGLGSGVGVGFVVGASRSREMRPRMAELYPPATPPIFVAAAIAVRLSVPLTCAEWHNVVALGIGVFGSSPVHPHYLPHLDILTKAFGRLLRLAGRFPLAAPGVEAQDLRGRSDRDRVSGGPPAPARRCLSSIRRSGASSSRRGRPSRAHHAADLSVRRSRRR